MPLNAAAGEFVPGGSSGGFGAAFEPSLAPKPSFAAALKAQAGTGAASGRQAAPGAQPKGSAQASASGQRVGGFSTQQARSGAEDVVDKYRSDKEAEASSWDKPLSFKAAASIPIPVPGRLAAAVAVHEGRSPSSGRYSATRPPLPRVESGLKLEELEFDELFLDCNENGCSRSLDKKSMLSPVLSPSSPQKATFPIPEKPESDALPAEAQQPTALEERTTVIADAEESPAPAVDSGAGAEKDGNGEEGAFAQATGERTSMEDETRSSFEVMVKEGDSPGGGERRKVTADDFQILHMIGEGGFGKVYQVQRKDNQKIYAMKVMKKNVVIKDNLKGTKAEREIMSKLRHPYVVNMHYAFQCQGRLYIIMDYFPGGQFLDMLMNHAPFDKYAYEIYTAEIVLGLEALHTRGIVHRDLKPENILVDVDGHLCITDFGCSKVLEDPSSPVRAQSWAGTELYMAPEQLQKKEYGQQVDWWALGALAWEMCVGDHPFYHKNRKVIHNNILKKKLVLPSWLDSQAHSFLKGVLNRDANKRLGASGDAEEIKAHPFFKAVKFDALLRREIAAPLQATCTSAVDVSAHNKKYTDAQACLSPLLSPALSSSHQALFSGFSWCGDLHLPPSAMCSAAYCEENFSDGDTPISKATTEGALLSPSFPQDGPNSADEDSEGLGGKKDRDSDNEKAQSSESETEDKKVVIEVVGPGGGALAVEGSMTGEGLMDPAMSPSAVSIPQPRVAPVF